VNFMCETIMKLQSLTDVKVFLLVDYPQRNKRRYCGSKELVETFQRKEGPSFCMASDVEVELDRSASGLIEKQAWRPQYQLNGSSMPNANGQPMAFQCSMPASPSIPADEENLSNSSYCLVDKSQTLKRDSTNATLVDPNDDGVPSKRPRSYCVDYSLNDSEIKEETTTEFPEYVIGDDEDVDDPATIALFGPGTSMLRNDSTDGLHGEDLRLNQNADMLAECQSFFYSLKAPERERAKINKLFGLPDPGVLYKKGTMENRLFISVCYSVGKNAALICPYPFTRENKEAVQSYWSHHCDRFVNFCSRIGLVVDKNQVDIEEMDCLKKNTAVGFIRQRIRDGFKKVATRGQGYF